MTSEDIERIVRDQIGDQWQRSNLHGVDLRRCLATPEAMTFIDASTEQPVEAWLVLLENPETQLGYAVVYQESSAQFGLAQFAVGYEPFLFGIYGDFFHALDAM